MSANLFSKLLRKFFDNPFLKMLQSTDFPPIVNNKATLKIPTALRLENLEPRVVPSTTTVENSLPDQSHKIAFIDSSLASKNTLIQQLQDSGTEVVELNVLQNGLEQIANSLANTSNLDEIHLFTQGICQFLGQYLQP